MASPDYNSTAYPCLTSAFKFDEYATFIQQTPED